MNTNRRGFFGAFAAAAAGVATAARQPAPPPPAQVDEFMELQKAFNRLRMEMERPIVLHMELDGREIAKQAVQFTPELIRAQGIR